jgi:hypothetical protein
VKFEPSRLRRGEIVVALAAVVLGALMFAAPWYGREGSAADSASALGLPTTIDGWDSLPTLRWLILIAVLTSLALVVAQATRRAPALPVSLSVIGIALAMLTTLCLIYRVLIAVPALGYTVGARAGAYLGLACSILLIYGGYRSLREEDRPDPARNAAIPTVQIGRRS